MFELRENAIGEYRIYFRGTQQNFIQKICKIMPTVSNKKKTHQNNKENLYEHKKPPTLGIASHDFVN